MKYQVDSVHDELALPLNQPERFLKKVLFCGQGKWQMMFVYLT